MPDLPVIDNAERNEIRAHLKTYMANHGIGAPRLYERMEYTLEGIDRHYVDLRSLQRFLRDDVRTDDEKVVRYRRFLSRAAPETVVGSSEPNFEAFFADTVRERNLLPIGVSTAEEPNRLIPLEEVTGRKSLLAYEGRYALTERAYGADTPDETPTNVHWLLFPDPDGAFLKIMALARVETEGVLPASPEEEIFEPVSLNAFMVPFGVADLLIMSLPRFGGGSFGLLRDISSMYPEGKVALEGPWLSACIPWETDEPVTTVRLVGIAGPQINTAS